MKKIGIIYGTFHQKEAKIMLAAATQEAEDLGLEIHAEIAVPGSVEKPLAIQRLLKAGDIDGVAVLGIIERGETKHGFTMGQSLMHFAMQLSLDYSKPVTLGVIGPDVLPEQIEPRLDSYARKAIKAQAIMLA